MKAVLFDLDDTLYTELDFVRSGFRAVAHVLARQTGESETFLVERLWEILEAQGRGHVFDTILNEVPSAPRSDDGVRLLTYVYRSHRPRIALSADAQPTLAALREGGVKLGIVTDGLGTVQRNKIAALGLDPLVDVIVCTDEIGRDWWKPSTTPFNVALALLGVGPVEAAYVGNDPGERLRRPQRARHDDDPDRLVGPRHAHP
jgi:putative hydrolase of the HAD superfamily